MTAQRATFERIRCGILRRLGCDIDLIKSAVAVEFLHTGEQISAPKAIALPGQYDRVRACAFGRSRKLEIAQLQGAPRAIGPTVRYELRDVLVANGILYGRGKQKYFNRLSAAEVPREWPKLDEVGLRSSFVGCQFFGHWLRDDCATHLLAADSPTTVSMPTPPWPDRRAYLDLFGQEYAELDYAHIRRLILFEDISQNAHKVERFRSLRTRMQTTAGMKEGDNEIVYIKRGGSGKRRALLNENELIDAMSARGVHIAQPEEHSADRLISALYGARIVISIEGSQLSHALYTIRDAGAILVIQPPNRFFNSHMDWARALGIHYAVTVGQERQSGFHLPVDDLLRTIDLLDART
jgi:glycosyl transferase family 61